MGALPSYAYGTATLHADGLLRSVLLLPRNLALAFLVAYRATISRLYGDVCRYYPSCSAYAVGAVQQYGAVRGALLSGWRILRCNPWSRGGVDDVQPRTPFRYELTRRGFVVPARKDMNSGS